MERYDLACSGRLLPVLGSLALKIVFRRSTIIYLLPFEALLEKMHIGLAI